MIPARSDWSSSMSSTSDTGDDSIRFLRCRFVIIFLGEGFPFSILVFLAFLSFAFDGTALLAPFSVSDCNPFLPGRRLISPVSRNGDRIRRDRWKIPENLLVCSPAQCSEPDSPSEPENRLLGIVAVVASD